MLVDKDTCTMIQCGALTQDQAGMDTIMQCANMGMVGVRSCLDPICVGKFRPAYCSPEHQDNQPIPYSPPNRSVGVKQAEGTPVYTGARLGVPSKVKQGELIECPGDRVSDFMVGIDSWFGDVSHMGSKAGLLDLIGSGEVLGLVVPALVVGGIGLWLVKSG